MNAMTNTPGTGLAALVKLPATPSQTATPSTLRDLLHCLLRYEPQTGLLFWKRRVDHLFPEGRHGSAHNAAKWNAKFAGRLALHGTSASHGYRAGAIFNKTVLAHRAIFAMHHGRWPEVVDHINGDKLDNRIGNLREVTQAENCKNNGGMKNGRYIGVREMSAGNFCAEIRHNKQSVYLGLFPTAVEAARARDAAALRLRGDLARLNFPEVRHA